MRVEANFASTFFVCFHRASNADGQGDAEIGWRCGSNFEENTINFQIIEVAYQTLLYQDVLSSKKNELLI